MLIDRDKLRDLIPAIAGKLQFRPTLVEKDYYLTIILNNIESLLSNKIVFKGGTLFNKVHLNYHRLSEDLDFAYLGDVDMNSRSQRSKILDPIRNKMSGFLEILQLTSDNPRGKGFNNSTQYVFNVRYPSYITGKDENIKIEISLRQPVMDKPVYNVVKHFYQDPFTGENILPTNKILSLSLNEAVSEKLKAAINRREMAIRDYYDLWYIAESGFDFYQKKFIELFKRKLSDEGYSGDFRNNFGLNAENLKKVYRLVETDLIPVIRAGEVFDFNGVLVRFNQILADKRFG